MPKFPGRPLAAPLALGALLALPGGAGAVNIRVEGAKRTLVPSSDVSLPSEPVGVAGRPTCPGRSGLGALDVATRGRWSGTYTEGLGYFVTTIEGEEHPGTRDFFTIWVNGRASQVGACSLRPRAEDELLYFVAPAGSNAKPVLPLELRAPKRLRAGGTLVVKVRSFAARGGRPVVPGATVTGSGIRVRTDADGLARIRPTRPGRISLRATAPGFVRSEHDTVRITAR